LAGEPCFLDEVITVGDHLRNLRDEYERKAFAPDENGNTHSYEKCQDLVSAMATYISECEAFMDDSCIHQKGNEDNKKS